MTMTQETQIGTDSQTSKTNEDSLGTFDQSLRDRHHLRELAFEERERRDNLFASFVNRREPITQLSYRKARNLPMEDDPTKDDEVKIDNRIYSLGDSPLLSFAKVAAIVSGMLGAGWIGSTMNARQSEPKRAQPAISQDHDTQYELRLID